MKILNLTLFISLFLYNCLNAQDAVYSLFDRNPIAINPALAGDIPEEQEHRVVYQHRVQWFDALREQRYEHFAVAYDRIFAICSSNKYASSFGFGIQAVSESIPYLTSVPNYKTNKLALDFAYRRTLSKTVYFAGGFEIEWLHHRLATEGLQFPAQYDGLGSFSPNTFNGENLIDPNSNTASALSMGAGIVLTIDHSGINKPRKINFGQIRIGSSLYHLTRPNLSLVAARDDQEATISRRWTSYFRWKIPANENFEFIPYGFYTLQGKGVWQFIGGGDFSLGFKEIPQLIPGLGFRLTNPSVSQQTITSLLLSLRIETKHFFIAGVTDIGFATFALGSNDDRVSTIEVAMGYKWGTYGNDKCNAMQCPNF